MLTRRTLMASAAATGVAVTSSPFTPALPEHQNALSLIAGAVRESIEIFYAEAGPENNYTAMVYPWLKRWNELDLKVLEELSRFYADAHREFGPLVDQENRLRPGVQIALTLRFPWVPTSWPSTVWDALAALVPNDMRN